MRIAQLCPYDIDRPGGVQRHILDLSSALSALGHDITIIAPRTGPTVARPDADAAAPSVSLVGRGLLVPFNKTQFELTAAFGAQKLRLRDLLRPGAFDILHFHTLLAPFLPLQALRMSRAVNVATFHEVPPDTATGAMQRLVLRKLGRRLRAQLDGTIYSSGVLQRLHDADDPHEPVLAPSTNLRRFLDHDERDAPGPNAVLTLLFLGRLEPRKGAAILLEAYRGLRERGAKVRLVIAGDGPERAKLEKFARRHGLTEVSFMGCIAHADAPRVLAACDIFCAPSLYAEGFGIVLTEAMAAGKPIVAAANAGYRTVLKGDASRFLVRPGDVRDLSTALMTLIGDARLRAELGAWGRREASRYDSATAAPRFVTFYEKAIAARRLADLKSSPAPGEIDDWSPAAPAESVPSREG